ncbi:MAG: Cytochrome c biogenesis protein CcsA [Phycisphaerae bacterium]|nr:Cytochrome c biogenesis protein CcsA [Phycisphaerae bacterium]
MSCRVRGLVTGIVCLVGAAGALAGEKAFDASRDAVVLDGQIDWTKARLIVVQHDRRYKTLDSFARESLYSMTRREHFPQLSPMASLMEWLFNRSAYADTPIVNLKEPGVRYHFTSHLNSDVVRDRIRRTGKMTLREFADPMIERRARELEPRPTMGTAMRRVREAQVVAQFFDETVRIVPQPGSDPDALWHTPQELLANVPQEFWNESGIDPAALLAGSGEPIAGISGEQALSIILPWVALRAAWLSHDAATVQAKLDELAERLPKLAAAGAYPSESQRAAEARYYAMGKVNFAWLVYFLGFLVSVMALVTNWKVARLAALLLLVAGLGLHAYGIALRWYILGRIPNANMFEAVVFAAWGAIFAAGVLELVFRWNLFMLAAHAAGFFALIVAQFVIPGGGTITSIMGILDDIMLRIHTVMIIFSYGLIFIAGVLALVYLFGYYYFTKPGASIEAGMMMALAGMWALAVLWIAYRNVQPGIVGVPKPAWLTLSGWIACGLCTLALCCWRLLRMRETGVAALFVAAVTCMVLGIGNDAFIWGVAWSLIGTGVVWAGGTGLGLLVSGSWPRTREVALPGAGSMRVDVGPALRNADRGDERRPILAGGMPGDERVFFERKLPEWLNQADWAHLIILNLVFVLLFGGVILGAVWADYSWGRPWGWDPKEVFAMNTWIIYAILIHVRFVVKQRGLWTAWLSVLGCLMMAFNWCYVNFFIVGMHSYA